MAYNFILCASSVIRSKTMKLLLKIFAFILFLINVSLSQELIWTHLNGPMGGTVADIIINSNQDIFAGVYGSIWGYYGIYKSTDNGDSWVKVITPFPQDFPVYALFLTKDEHIWVGTDHYGLYRSTDNGITWEKKDNGYITNECWAFGESNDRVLFAGDGQYNRVFRSTNNGDNWELSTYLRPYSFATDSNNKVYMGTATGLYSTTNNGLTWLQNSFFQNIAVSSVLIDDRNNLYCGTGYYGNGNGVFMSTDGGISWAQLGLPAKVVLSLAFDSQKNLYAGTLSDGVFKTTDMGQSWTQSQEGIYRQQILRIKINENDDIFVCGEGDGGWAYTDGGVFISTNGGVDFMQTGLPISNVKNIVFSGDSLIIASTPSGVQKYNRISKMWKNIGLHKVEAVSITQSNTLYAATRDDGLFKSTNFGLDWSMLDVAGDTILPTFNVLAINDDSIFISSAYWMNARRTIDGGNSWEILPIKNGETLRGLFYRNDTLWLTGVLNSGIANLYRSLDFGVTYDSLISGASSNQTHSPFVVTNSGYIFFVNKDESFSNPGIFRSKNYGLNWEQVLSGTINWTVYADDNGLVLTGSESGRIFVSQNFGDSWTIINQPAGTLVTDIKKDNQGKIFFGTLSGGLFEVDVITSIEVPSFTRPQSYFLFQNYPNPFNPSTKISWQSPVESLQTLKVIDVLGREVAVLVDEYKPAGKYELEFDASALPSGVYFYSLQAGEFRDSKKMILLR